MRGYASIWLKGKVLDFNKISKYLNLKPDSITKAGDYSKTRGIAEYDIWGYCSRNARKNKAPRKSLDYLFKKINHNINYYKSIDKLYSCGVESIDIGFLMEVTGSHCMFKIERHHIVAALKLNANISFDVWRTKYRTSSFCNMKNQMKNEHLYYESNFGYCSFTIEAEKLRSFLELGLEPIVHVW